MLAVKIRLMTENDIPATRELIKSVFDQFEAPDYSPDGVFEFYKYITLEEMQLRLQGNYLDLIAIIEGKIVGMIEVRDQKHISLLFVDCNFHRRGIAKTLLTEIRRIFRHQGSIAKEFTVNSSPFAVPVYEKLGFQLAAPEQLKNGIRFFPMKSSL